MRYGLVHLYCIYLRGIEICNGENDSGVEVEENNGILVEEMWVKADVIKEREDER